MAQVTIARFDSIGRTKKHTPYSRIQTDEGNWINITGEDLSKSVGQTIEIGEPEKFGANYWAYFQSFIKAPTPQKEAPMRPESPLKAPIPSGPISWGQFTDLISLVHAIAKELEPDTDQTVPDRARARVALMATILIPVLDGKVELPIEDEEAPF